MWLKGLENNKKKNCMFLDFVFETLCWGEKNIYIIKQICVGVQYCNEGFKKNENQYVTMRGKGWQWNKLK